jgi:ferrous iron transport protein A
MSQAALLPLVELDTQEQSPDGLASKAIGALSHVPVGTTVEVTALELEVDLAAWLRAVGIREKERVTVLRRAAFGGPIHVRTGAGGEFALHGSLAAQVRTRARGGVPEHPEAGPGLATARPGTLGDPPKPPGLPP